VDADARDPHSQQLVLFGAARDTRSPHERYGPFPDGMHLVVWRTLCVWTLGDWLRARQWSA